MVKMVILLLQLNNWPKTTLHFFGQGIGVNYSNYQVQSARIQRRHCHLLTSRAGSIFLQKRPWCRIRYYLSVAHKIHGSWRRKSYFRWLHVTISTRYVSETRCPYDIATVGLTLKTDVYFWSIHTGVFARGRVNNKKNGLPASSLDWSITIGRLELAMT